MPRVSIITALYNHEKYVAETIESVLAQTFGDFEHIIWDDGSSDDGLAIARKYAERDSRVRVFTHKGGANRGQENTRNAALEKASGELLCLLDSDDLYYPRKLELLVPCFENPRVGLAYGRFEHHVQATGKREPSGVALEPQGRVLRELLFENFIGATACVFRAKCVESGLKFDASFRTMGEYPLWIKIARDWEIAHVPEVVSAWRDHGENLGTKLKVQAKRELVDYFERLERDQEYEKYWPHVAQALALKRYDYASELYYEQELAAARGQAIDVVLDGAAPQGARLKASLLAGLSLLGPVPNRGLARIKRSFWELRRKRLR